MSIIRFGSAAVVGLLPKQIPRRGEGHPRRGEEREPCDRLFQNHNFKDDLRIVKILARFIQTRFLAPRLPNNGLRVPARSSAWSGTGTVVVLLDSFRCMTTWLPRLRTSAKLCLDKIRQTSFPERTRNLPTHHLQAGYINLAVEPGGHFPGRSGFKNSSSASCRFSRASFILPPWLAISSSGQRATYPSPFPFNNRRQIVFHRYPPG